MRRTCHCAVVFVSLIFTLGACSKLGTMKIDVADKASATTPVIQMMDPENPKKGDVVTLKGNNFRGSSLDGVLVLSNNSHIKVNIAVTGEAEGTFHLDEGLPENAKILQVLILKKDVVLTTFTVPTSSSAIAATPTFSPAAGAYGPAQTVTLSTTTEGAEIFYTLDGKEPDSSAQKYQSPIAVSQSMTIKAIAIKIGNSSSAPASASYTINGAVATPVASLPAGVYSSDQTVTLTTATEGARILYTTDGSTPGNTASVYSGPLTLSGNTTLKAIAIKSGYSASEILSVNYAFKVAKPTASVTGDFYTSRQNVTLATATSGASIYYTTDGSTPSTSSSLYTGPIAIVGKKTLQAIAVKTGCTASNLLSEDYMVILQFMPSSAANNDGSGMTVTVLTNGNIVVAKPYADVGGVSDAGSVSLYNGTTGALISTVTGSTLSDSVGIGITALTNGNFVIQSWNWDCQASLGCSGTIANVGAATWVNGSTGLSGVVNASNSLVGSTANDQVGAADALTNGNYVVRSSSWDCQASLGCSGTVVDVGAATWGNGTTGISGFVNTANSLVGSTASDRVGNGMIVLANGNYVVRSSNWDCQASLGCSGTVADVGAATWGNGATGTTGIVNASNSLVGSTANDMVSGSGITALTNGNYVVQSSNWDCQASLGCSGTITNVGAVTWGNGATGTTGFVSASNSLVGSTASDGVGSGVTALTNGNYLVRSSSWDCQASLGCSGTIANVGAVTWGNGAIGITGFVSTSNSLVGSTATDQIGSGVTALTNGNYLVRSTSWDCQASLGCSGTIADVGAVTWGNGTTGITGFVNTSNSLVGSTASDMVGSGITTLTNGNYVVQSYSWDCQAALGCSGTAVDVGAVTWGNGTTGITGFINTSNSLVGSTANDRVGYLVAALANGNYVVQNQNWDCQASLGCSGTIADVGAVTWGNGATGVTGFVNTSNSLAGSTASDTVGSSGITALTNGNYVVRSQNWDCQASLGCSGTIVNAGAVTWGNGTTGVTGLVSTSNSLVGSTASDQIGSTVTALSNGNYVVSSGNFDSAANTNLGVAFIASGSSTMFGIIPN